MIRREWLGVLKIFNWGIVVLVSIKSFSFPLINSSHLNIAELKKKKKLKEGKTLNFRIKLTAPQVKYIRLSNSIQIPYYIQLEKLPNGTRQ